MKKQLFYLLTLIVIFFILVFLLFPACSRTHVIYRSMRPWERDLFEGRKDTVYTESGHRAWLGQYGKITIEMGEFDEFYRGVEKIKYLTYPAYLDTASVFDCAEKYLRR